MWASRAAAAWLQLLADLTESQKETDELFEQHGIKINVDPKSLLYLNGTTIDFKDEIKGAGSSSATRTPPVPVVWVQLSFDFPRGTGPKPVPLSFPGLRGDAVARVTGVCSAATSGSAPRMRPSEGWSRSDRGRWNRSPAEMTLPSGVPFRVIAPLKCPNRCSASAVGVPAAAAATFSPCATSRAVAVSRPDRGICQVITEHAARIHRIARHLRHARLIDMLGSVQDPDWNSWVQGPRAGRGRITKGRLSQNPKASASSGTTTSPSAVTASLIGASGSRP